MCTRCAVKTPVGYRCRECVRSQQDKFFDAQLRDYLIAGVVSLTISFFAAGLLARLGWFLIAFFLSPAAGALIGRAVWRLTGRRRGRYTAIVVGANVVVGALPFFLINPLTIGIYLVMATGTAVAQFRPRL
jgi:Na+/proline symporter